MSLPISSAPTLPEWLAPARRRGLFSRLPDAVIASLIQGSQRVSYPSGAVIPGWEEGPWAAILLSGTARIYLPSPNGDQVTLRYLRPGETVGSFVAVTASYARSLEAVDDSEILHIDVGRLESIVRTEVVVAYELLVETSRAMRLAHRAYSLRAFGSIRVRVANAILERAAARGDIRAGTVVQGTQHELGVAAGTVREVVAAAVQRLKQDGIVDVKRGAVVIVDPVALAREAEGGGGFWPIAEAT